MSNMKVNYSSIQTCENLSLNLKKNNLKLSTRLLNNLQFYNH